LLAKRERNVQRFQELLYLGFDVPYIARFVLGRYWNAATADQREEYERLFTRMILKIYADRFSLYAGETLKVVGSRQDSSVDAIVSSQIVRPSGPPINVDWRVRDRNGEYKIIDVVVEGISMGVVQRDEFSSVIQRGGGNIDALLTVLRRRAGELEP
jgi:phospholipid transport system substrate-binding protein